MSYLHGKFVWFEHASGDIPKARSFYEALLGWHTESMPVGERRYSMILNKSDAIGGYGPAAAGEPGRWRSYLSVADVDASHAAALAAGGKSLTAPTNFGDVGRAAQLADPGGASFWVWRSTTGDRADTAVPPAGDWCWNELYTPNDTQALAFYERVFGYTHDSMDMGPQGTYYLLKKDGVMRGGLMCSTEPEAPALWLPYVGVDDCDACATKAKSLGAQVVVPPTDIPNVGRFAVLVDPLGASIAVMRGIPPKP
jgi:predicted enzyme related to lactoylglutathione lyase